MQQSQHHHRQTTTGFNPSVVDAALRANSLCSTEAVQALKPMSVADASAFLRIPASEVIELAIEGLIPHRHSARLNKFYFNLCGLLRYCESLTDFEDIPLQKEPSAKPKSEQLSSPLVKEESKKFNPRTSVDTTNEAASQSIINIEPVPSETRKSKELKPLINRESFDADTVLERMENLLKKKPGDLSRILDQWGLDDHLYARNLAFIEYHAVNIGTVNSKVSSELRMDIRSSHKLKALFKNAGVNLTERLHTCDFRTAVNRAADSLKSKLQSLDTPFDKTLTFQQQNNQILSNVLKKATRRVRDNKSSSSQVRERHRKLAFFNYIFANFDMSLITQELVELINDAFVFHARADSTRNKYMIELRAIYNELFHNRLVSEYIEIESYQSGCRSLIELAPSEFKNFKQHYAQNQTEENLLTFAFWSGMRRGNSLKHLRVSQLKLEECDDGTLRNISFLKIPAYNTKGKRLVTVHITQPIKEAIEEQLKYRRRNGITHDNLFALDNAGSLVNIDPQRWKSALIAAGIDESFRFHHFRHNRAYQILLAGGDFEDVRQLFGLASTKMVATVYGHLDLTEKAIQANNKTVSDTLS